MNKKLFFLLLSFSWLIVFNSNGSDNLKNYCVRDKKNGVEYTVYPEFCNTGGYYSNVLKNNQIVKSGPHQSLERIILWDSVIDRYQDSVNFMNSFDHEFLVRFEKNVASYTFDEKCEAEDELECAHDSYANHFCVRYLAICGFEESVHDVVQSVENCFGQKSGLSYFKQYPHHCLRGVENKQESAEIVKSCLETINSQTKSVSVNTQRRCEEIIQKSYQAWRKEYLYYKDKVFKELNKVPLNNQAEYYSNKLLSLNVKLQSLKLDYKLDELLQSFGKQVVVEDDKKILDRYLNQCQKQVIKNRTEIDLNNIVDEGNLNRSESFDYVEDLIDLSNKISTKSNLTKTEAISQITINLKNTNLDEAMKAIISSYKSFNKHQFNFGDESGEQKEAKDRLFQELETRFKSRLNQNQIKRGDYPALTKIFEQYFNVHYKSVAEQHNKIKIYEWKNYESKINQANQKIRSLNSSCRAIKTKKEESILKFYDDLQNKDHININNSSLQDYYYTLVRQPFLQNLLNLENNSIKAMRSVIDSELGFIFLDSKNTADIGVPGTGNLSIGGVDIYGENSWMERYCVAKKEDPFKEITKVHFVRGKEAAYNKAFDFFIHEMTVQAKDFEKHLANYLEINPAMVTSLIDSDQDLAKYTALCQVMLNLNHSKYWKNIGRKIFLVSGISASILLAFTGIGSGAGALLLSTIIGVSSAGDIAVNLMENRDIKSKLKLLNSSMFVNQQLSTGIALYQNSGRSLYENLKNINISKQQIKANNKQSLIMVIAVAAPVSLKWVGRSIKSHPALKSLLKNSKNAKAILNSSDEAIGEVVKKGANKIAKLTKKNKNLAKALLDIDGNDLNLLNYIIGSIDDIEIIERILLQVSSLNKSNKSKFILSLLLSLDEIVDVKNALALIDELASISGARISFTGASMVDDQANLSKTANGIANNLDEAARMSRLINGEINKANYLTRFGLTKDNPIYKVIEKKFPDGLPISSNEIQKLDDILAFVVEKRKFINQKLPPGYNSFDDLFDDLWAVENGGRAASDLVSTDWYRIFSNYKNYWKNKTTSITKRLKKRGIEQTDELARRRISHLKSKRAMCKSPDQSSYVKDFGPYMRDSIIAGLLIGNMTLTTIPQSSRDDFKNAWGAAFPPQGTKPNYTPILNFAEYYQGFEGFWNAAYSMVPGSMKFFGNNNKLLEVAVYYGTFTALDYGYGAMYTELYSSEIKEDNKLSSTLELLNKYSSEDLLYTYGEKFHEILERENLSFYLEDYLRRTKDTSDDIFKNSDYVKVCENPNDVLCKISHDEDLLEVFSSAVMELDYEVSGGALNKLYNTGSFETDLFFYNETWLFGGAIPDSIVFGQIQYLYCMGSLKTARGILATYFAGKYGAFWAGREKILRQREMNIGEKY